MERAWEDQISLNSFRDFKAEPLLLPRAYADQQTNIKPSTLVSEEELNRLLSLDDAPLPDTSDREGYCGPRHFEYWLHGLRDYLILKSLAKDFRIEIESMLDMGCASGRVIRHFAAHEAEMQVMGCDINALHVAWCLEYLPKAQVFQSTSVPYFPLPDNSVSLVTAFSVFSHIEAFETAWLMEIKRILRPGGIAYLTVHTENTMNNMKPTWPLYKYLVNFPDFTPDMIGKGLSKGRTVFRLDRGRSYSSNVFLRDDYVKNVWGKFLEVVDIVPREPGFQEAVVLRKR